MKLKTIILFLTIICFACKTDRNVTTENQNKNSNSAIPFEKDKWSIKDGNDYSYRNKMLNDILYNDSIRTLNKDQLIELLGEPDYTRAGHLYYRIKETLIGNWPLKTKTMVVKLLEDNSIEWIKIHE